MKILKEMKRYCPKCKKRTVCKVSQNKSGGKRNALSEGNRRFEKKKAGYGSFPRKKPEKCKRWGVKQAKKIDLRYTCKECKKGITCKAGKRAKKVEWVAAK